MNIFLFLYVLKNIKILHLAKTWIRKIYNLDKKGYVEKKIAPWVCPN